MTLPFGSGETVFHPISLLFNRPERIVAQSVKKDRFHRFDTRYNARNDSDDENIVFLKHLSLLPEQFSKTAEGNSGLPKFFAFYVTFSLCGSSFQPRNQSFNGRWSVKMRDEKTQRYRGTSSTLPDTRIMPRIFRRHEQFRVRYQRVIRHR